MADKGWIKLYRQILDCSLWIGLDDEETEPFDKRSAWIDLLLRANHSDKEILFNYKPITVSRGQLITSVRKLANRWGWCVKKTYNYLNMLVDLGMITKESDFNKTLLTIVNYGIYQDLGNSQETVNNTVKKQSRNTKETLNAHKQECKECKNEKNEKNQREKPLGAKTESYYEDESLNQAFSDFVDMRKKIKKPLTDHAIDLQKKKLKELSCLPFSDTMDVELAIKILNQSTMNSWLGLFPLKENQQKGNGRQAIDWDNV